MTPAEVHVWLRLPQEDGWPPHDREADADNWASRVVPLRPLEADHVLANFADLACDPWVTRSRVVVLEIDGRVDPDPVIEELFRGRAAGEWDFDLSVSPDSPVLRRLAAH